MHKTDYASANAPGNSHCRAFILTSWYSDFVLLQLRADRTLTLTPALEILFIQHRDGKARSAQLDFQIKY